MSKLKVLMVSSEVEPFAKTGGLGDVVGALPKALIKQDVDVRVIMPLYGIISDAYRSKMKYLGYNYIDVGWRHQYCGIYELKYENVTFYFLDNEFYYRRNKIYDNMDLERFSYLDIATFEVAQYVSFAPDIIHIHDWQTGPIAALLDAKYKYLPAFKKTKVVYTIHNLQYQGKFDVGHVMDMLPLPHSYFGYESLANFMRLGIIFSHKVTTVSPTYKDEIKTSYYGEGLNGLLSYYDFKLQGILNGIDYRTYNPSDDKLITFNYNKDNYVEGKKQNKKQLLESLGLENKDGRPLVSIITRLAVQKGVDIILAIMDRLLSQDINLVLLGSGERNYENSFNYFACKYPTKFRAVLKFDNTLAHRIYAASDLFLMPSQFEPCGLAQMICLSYGTLPLVRSCGGLKDSITPYNEYEGTGNGFSFDNYNADDFLNTINYALSIYRQPDKWSQIINNGFNCDFSWDCSANKYLEIYKELYYIDHKVKNERKKGN